MKANHPFQHQTLRIIQLAPCNNHNYSLELWIEKHEPIYLDNEKSDEKMYDNGKTTLHNQTCE